MIISSKDKYRKFCETETNIPIFSRDWWLDVVCGKENWDVVLEEKGDEIVATMPYFIKKKYGFTLLSMPPLTQTLGPWIRPSKARYHKQLSYQKNVMTALIDQLPKFDLFSQNWNYSLTNWLPFYWKGFKQTVYYTYVLEDLQDLEKVWQGFQINIRGDIRKGKNRFNLKVGRDLSIDKFLDILEKTFQRQGLGLPYSKNFVRRLDQICAQRKCRRIFSAEDEQGQQHAAVYLVWDENSAYYLMGGSNPELRNSGATSLLIWEGIRFASLVTKKFDFEGSMIEPVERFFRAFGAIQKPYFAVSKTNSVLLKSALYARKLIKK